MNRSQIIWVMYERPEVRFEDLALRFADIRTSASTSSQLGVKAELVAIPTTSGTGAGGHPSVRHRRRHRHEVSLADATS